MSRIKTSNGPRVHRISPVGKQQVYGGGKDLWRKLETHLRTKWSCMNFLHTYTLAL